MGDTHRSEGGWEVPEAHVAMGLHPLREVLVLAGSQLPARTVEAAGLSRPPSQLTAAHGAVYTHTLVLLPCDNSNRIDALGLMQSTQRLRSCGDQSADIMHRQRHACTCSSFSVRVSPLRAQWNEDKWKQTDRNNDSSAGNRMRIPM